MEPARGAGLGHGNGSGPMKLIYKGFSFQIVCREGRHEWLRIRYALPPAKRLFAAKSCDCAQLKEMGVSIPLNAEIKRAINYFAPQK